MVSVGVALASLPAGQRRFCNGKTEGDVVVIGAGVTGTAVARELARYQVKVFLVEKYPDVACGCTKANTAIVHAGYDATPGTWKAKLNVRGAAVYPQICRELEVKFKPTGSLVVALAEDQVPHLYELLNRGYVNGVPDLKIIGREQLLAQEPYLNPKAVAALWAPTAGLVDPWGLAIAQAENAAENGVEVLLGALVEGLELKDGLVTAVRTRTRLYKRAMWSMPPAGIPMKLPAWWVKMTFVLCREKGVLRL